MNWVDAWGRFDTEQEEKQFKEEAMQLFATGHRLSNDQLSYVMFNKSGMLRRGERLHTQWKHEESGVMYEIDHLAFVEATMQPVVVYRPSTREQFEVFSPRFTRPIDEFVAKFVPVAQKKVWQTIELGTNDVG